ncbi:hypothetical protein FRC02_012160 [Tulasnella sp. 418]|nr:hypothetical protein FRC02_012160 [Tulasnella sp. 418]
MWLFRRRSVSPNSENNDITNTIQEAQVKLLAAKNELVDLPIPEMKETFVMIYDLLEHCKKSKGDPAPINAFIELLTRLIDGVHDFITKSKRRGEADMTKSPADSIEALFTELFHLFSARQQLSASSTNRIDLSSNLATLNPDISAAIQKFINKESNHDRAEQVRAWVLDMSRIDQSTGESIDVGKVIKQAQHPLTIPRNTNPEQVFPGATHNDKFRILLLGKSGVGKSSLIQSIFGVRQMDVARLRIGSCDINREFTSSNNPQIILHDSAGFKSGSPEN